jgi:hypothetical protein
MKFFWVSRNASRNIKVYTCFALVICLASCATHHAQYGKSANALPADTIINSDVAHRFYLVGDAGLATQPQSQQLLGIIKQKLDKEDKNSSLFYLGDNIYPLGMPPKDHKDRAEAEASLNSQLALAEGFKGKTYIIPGNHDWYHGLAGLYEEEKLVREKLGKKAFLPGNGCGITDVKINDDITLIAIDSEWFIEDWDRYPTINDDCDIKTRDELFAELEDLINKNQQKTIILAIHHPLMSNGSHGGELSLRKELFPLQYNIPLPILGSLANLIRNTGGVVSQDISSKIYTTLSNRIKALIQDKDNIIVISGHDHNLQFIRKDNINQIISGSGSKVEAARVKYPEDFSYGGTGYATLDVYKNGLAKVAYFKTIPKGEEKIFEKVLLQKPKIAIDKFPDTFPATTKASVYTQEMTKRSRFYRFLFGTHYSSYYSTLIEVPVVSLDTLQGGLTTGKTGGGHQSNSLRLIDKEGKEYVMRGIKKSATRFLQAVAFKDRFVGDDYANTSTENFLMDFYTTAHPYTPFIIDDLEETAGIYHTNPELYYIPKQNLLKEHNADFGDELYMVEERPTDEFKDQASFGNPDGIDSTDDLYKNLHKDKKYKVDERAYIRARLFDILVGDFDRHADQWRWSRFDTNDSIYYRPIPRDRDQAFPKFGGALLTLIMQSPPLRYMKPYKDDISSVKWLARAGYAQDLSLITHAGENVWIEEANVLQQALTDAEIDKAFSGLPNEVKDATMETIKTNLKKRREKLKKYALDYRKVLLRTVLITGTDKKEKFGIKRLPDGVTNVEVFSIKKDSQTLISSKSYNHTQTKEIWIYGLDDDDIFEISGKPEKPITLRLLGGLNHDSYTVENGKRVKIYDFKSKENSYNVDSKTQKLLTNDYETNSYDVNKPVYNVFAGYPAIGYNPDDGVKIGASITYTVNNFNRRPYSRRHNFKANYYFATHGFELIYRGTFMNIASKWNFALDARFTSPNFSINYFGYGNDTKNYDSDLGMNYNRVKLQIFKVAPSFFKQGRNGSFMELQLPFETIEVDGSNNRFVNQPGNIAERLFEHRLYAGVQATYSFKNYDNASLPARGMYFYITGGWKTSLDEIERNFPHLESSLNFVHRITANEKLVLSSTVKTKILLSNGFEFYQAATLGGDTDLRGYRRERFTGKKSFYQSTDLRLTLGRWKSSFVPVTYGILGGYDYGRVWIEDDRTDKWHQTGGGGFWLNGADLITARVTYFQGADGGRLAVGLSFGF